MNRKATRLQPISIRMPADLWQKCEWAASAVGLDRTTFVRNALASVAKDAKPPANAKYREVLASDEEWRAWHAIADHFEVPLNELMRKTLKRLVVRAKADGILVDG
jgi:uncharacterized protein (DUF1778 family)